MLPLRDIRVLDVATLFAGPQAAALLADFGADVVKIEHPQGDPARRNGPQSRNASLWWKLVARNKRAITLYLGSPEGRRIFLDLARNGCGGGELPPGHL